VGYYHSEFGTGTILSRDNIKSGWAGDPPKQLTYVHATQPTMKRSESNKQHSTARADVRKEGRRRMKVKKRRMTLRRNFKLKKWKSKVRVFTFVVL
jgi:hypothetical protein